MASDFLKRALLLLFLLFFVNVAWAQHSEGDGKRVYRKSSADSVRLRPGAVKKERVKSKSVKRKVKKSPAKSVKKDGVDSVRYTARQYALGDRVIMRGDSGKDVRKVADILVNNLYIEEKQLQYTAGGEVLYEGELVKAVMRFQEYNGFYPDGIVGYTLIKALKKL